MWKRDAHSRICRELWHASESITQERPSAARKICQTWTRTRKNVWKNKKYKINMKLYYYINIIYIIYIYTYCISFMSMWESIQNIWWSCRPKVCSATDPCLIPASSKYPGIFKTAYLATMCDFMMCEFGSHALESLFQPFLSHHLFLNFISLSKLSSGASCVEISGDLSTFAKRTFFFSQNGEVFCRRFLHLPRPATCIQHAAPLWRSSRRA